MTGLTPETLPRHELVGLRVEVVEASDPGMVGIAGRVVSETANTLVIEGRVGPEARCERGGEAAGQEPSREWQVPKAGTTFEFALTDEAAPDREAGGTASELRSETAGEGVAGDDSSPATGAGQSDRCEGVAYVTVDGARLLSRPARRTETGGASKWR